jgi:hypothetical protein
MSDLLDRVAEKLAVDPAARSVLQVLVGDPPDDPAALTRTARSINTARLRVAWTDFEASALRTGDVIKVLPSVTTRQGVHQLRSSGALLGVVAGRETLFPAWQFGPTGLRRHLKRILDALHSFSSDVVAADRVMRMPRPELDGLPLAEALGRRDHEDAAWVVLDGLGGPR